jgi:hypothetical protein
MRTPTGPVSLIAPRTWYSVFLAAHPEAERATRSILFDEKDELYQPDGVLRFTARQAKRYPDQALAIDVRGMTGVDIERGQNGWIFGPSSYNNEGMNYSDHYFYELRHVRIDLGGRLRTQNGVASHRKMLAPQPRRKPCEP